MAGHSRPYCERCRLEGLKETRRKASHKRWEQVRSQRLQESAHRAWHRRLVLLLSRLPEIQAKAGVRKFTWIGKADPSPLVPSGFQQGGLNPCGWCHRVTWTTGNGSGPRRGCSKECRVLLGKANRMRRRVTKKNGKLVEDFDPVEIYERDGWVCHLCGGAVIPVLPLGGYFPDRPSLDHLVPLSHGGEHSRANVKLAHQGCNTRRGVKLLDVAG